MLEQAGEAGMHEAEKLVKEQASVSADDPNRPETEEDGIRAEALRRLKVRRQYGQRRGQTQA